MRYKSISSSTICCRKFLAIICCMLLAVFLFACGGGSSSNQSSSDTGAIAFSVKWPDQLTETNMARAVDCASSGVASITAELYEAAGDHVVSGGPWACSAHSGTMQNVPAGINRTLNVYGKDGDGNVLYMGVTTGIDVVAGQTADAGTVALDTAMYMAIDGAYVQYRVHWDGVNDRYQGWVELTKFGDPFNLEDILTPSEIVSLTTLNQSKSDVIKSKIKLKNSSGTGIPIESAGHERQSYFWGTWNSSTSSVDFGGPFLYSGIWLPINAGSIPAGDYTYEVTTREGDVISKTLYFPGQTSLPVVQAATMSQAWLGDDSLRLSWIHPGGSFDQFRVIVLDQNNNILFFAALPPSVTDITVSAQVVQNITDTFGPYAARWRMETRNYDSNNNYARGRSDYINFNWPYRPSGPGGSYDLMAYFPLSAGSWWMYDGTNTCDQVYTEEEDVSYGGNFKGLSNITRYGVDDNESDFFNFDGQYIYYHGYTEYDVLDLDYGTTWHKPSLAFKRFLQVGESTTASSTEVYPDGSEHSFQMTITLLGIENVTVPYATFTDCLKFEQVSYVGGILDERGYMWWCENVGEVKYQEIEDPQGACLDTSVLSDYQVLGY